MGIGKTFFVAFFTAVITAAATFFGLRIWTLRPATIILPSFVGLEEKQAESFAKTIGVKFVVTQQSESTVQKPGHIISHLPPVKTKISVGNEIQAIVSKGSPMTGVPNLLGMSESDAKKALLSAGLQEGQTTHEANEKIAKGKVIKADPPFGSSVEPGGQINLVVSNGAKQTFVPRVIGKQLSVAKQLIKEAKLSVGKINYFYDQDRAPDIVIRQSPNPSTEVAPGSTIIMSVNRHYD